MNSVEKILARFHGGKRFLGGLLLIISICGYFSTAISHMNEILLQEKFLDVKSSIDLVFNQIDRSVTANDDWLTRNYVEIIGALVQHIDDWPGVYGELMDENLATLSTRVPTYPPGAGKEELPENVMFDPRKYPEVLARLQTEDRGEAVVSFSAPGIAAHDMHLYWRWVPTDKKLKNRMLAVVGVSKHSVNSTIAAWVSYGAIALILISSAIFLWAIMTRCRHGAYK